MDETSRPDVSVKVLKSELVRATLMLNNLLDRAELESSDAEPATGKVSASRSAAERSALLDMARRLVSTRNARTRFFAGAMFGEPPWDILLTLYISDHTRDAVSVNRIADLAGVPATSTKRWLDYLERERLIVRRSHPTDLRMVIVEITPRCRDLLERYFVHLIGMQRTTISL